MNRPTFSNLVLWLALAAGLAINSPSRAQQFQGEPPPYYEFQGASDSGIWPLHIRVGGLVGLKAKADFKMGGTFGVSSSSPGGAGSGLNHIYDDGYVRVDDTGNARGYTSYWGYQNASQYDGVNTLTFHSATAYNTSGAAHEDSGVLPGLELAFGGHLWRYRSAWIGWEAGLDWLAINIADENPQTATVTRTVHQFNTGGILLPGAPYNGGSSGIGPTIRDLATVVSTNQTTSGSVSGSRELDVSLFAFRLGPTVHWELTRQFALAASAGPVVGLVSGKLKYDEQITVSGTPATSNVGNSSSTELVYGGYVNAILMYHAVDHGDIYVGAQYMPLSSSTFTAPGREAKLDLSGGLYFMVGVNWPF